MRGFIVVLLLFINYVLATPCPLPFYRDGCGKCSSAGPPFAYGPTDCIGTTLIADMCGQPNGDNSICTSSTTNIPFDSLAFMHLSFNESIDHGLTHYPGQFVNHKSHDAPWSKIGKNTIVGLDESQNPLLIQEPSFNGFRGVSLNETSGLVMAWPSEVFEVTSTYKMFEYGVSFNPSPPFSLAIHKNMGLGIIFIPHAENWFGGDHVLASFSHHELSTPQDCTGPSEVSHYMEAGINGTTGEFYLKYNNIAYSVSCIHISGPFPESSHAGKLTHVYIRIDGTSGQRIELVVNGAVIASYTITGGGDEVSPGLSGGIFSPYQSPEPGSILGHDKFGFTLNGLLNGEKRGDFDVFRTTFWSDVSSHPLSDGEIITLSQLDVCGVAFGDGSTCAGFDNLICIFDCAGICNGTTIADVCGTCNGTLTDVFYDFCGVECGNGSTCYTPEDFIQKNSSYVHKSECSIQQFQLDNHTLPLGLDSSENLVTLKAHVDLVPNVTDSRVTLLCINETLQDKLNLGWIKTEMESRDWWELTIKSVDLFICTGYTEGSTELSLDGKLLVETFFVDYILPGTNKTFNGTLNEHECCFKANLQNMGTSSDVFDVFGIDQFLIDITVIENTFDCNKTTCKNCELTHTFQTCIPLINGVKTRLYMPDIDQIQTIGNPPFHFIDNGTECDPWVTDKCCQIWNIQSDNIMGLNCFTTCLSLTFKHLFNGTDCFNLVLRKPHFIDICPPEPDDVDLMKFDVDLKLHKDALIQFPSNSFVDGARVYGEMILTPVPEIDCDKFILFIKEGRVCVPISDAVGPISGCDDPNAAIHVFQKSSIGFTGGTYFSTSISPHPSFPICTSKLVLSWFARLLNSFSSRVIVEVDWSFSIATAPYHLIEFPMYTMVKTIDLAQKTHPMKYNPLKLESPIPTTINDKALTITNPSKPPMKTSITEFTVICPPGQVFNNMHGYCVCQSTTYNYSNWICVLLFSIILVVLLVTCLFKLRAHWTGLVWNGHITHYHTDNPALDIHHTGHEKSQ
jgi:hypothetical protein